MNDGVRRVFLAVTNETSEVERFRNPFSHRSLFYRFPTGADQPVYRFENKVQHTDAV